MSLIARILPLILFGIFILFTPISHAEDINNVKEIIAEATYQMSDTDTPAKAEEQALLRAKRNAFEQISSQTIDMDTLNNLPDEIFSTSILDKKKTLNANSLQIWIQIKAVINPDKLESALKGNLSFSLWSGAPQYYCERMSYFNGTVSKSKLWVRNNWDRSEYDFGTTTIRKFERKDGGFLVHEWNIRHNKYIEAPPYTVKEEKIPIGTEIVSSVNADKRRVLITTIFQGGPIPQVTGSMIEWFDPQTKLILKMQPDPNPDQSTTLFQNYQIGPQDPSLFQIPSNFIKCNTFEELLSEPSTTPAQQNSPGNDAVDDAINSALNAAAQKALDNSLNNILGF